MAYSAPELLLVGAAQNLVLAGGSVVFSGKVECPSNEQEDSEIFYDGLPLW